MRTSESVMDAPDTQRAGLKSGEGTRIEKAVTINRPVAEVYAFWRHLENLPRISLHLVSVTSLDDGISHWTVRTTKGQTLEWDAQTIEDRPNELISWESLPDSEVETAGSVWFTPAVGGRGTMVKVAMKYAPASGAVGRMIAKFFKGPAKKELAKSLFRFKSLMETGEIPTIAGQPAGNQSSRSSSSH